jgi:ubiquinone/menaquinone biosynthesis C-methylase UbiE
MKEISLIDLSHLKIIRESVSDLIKKASAFDSYGIDVLDIAPQIHSGAKEHFLKSNVFTLDIDPNSNASYVADLCQNNSDLIPDEKFDIIICTEVLEHTLQPFSAVNEIYRILKVGGLCFISTPFNFRIHGPLPDCWRFSEYGLKSLFREFNEIQITPIEDDSRFLMPIHYQSILKK